MAYWPLRDGAPGDTVPTGAGNAAQDVIQSGLTFNNGTANNATSTWQADPERGIMWDSPNGNRINLGTQGIDLENGFTWSFWVRLDEGGTHRVLMGTRQEFNPGVGNRWHKFQLAQVENWNSNISGYSGHIHLGQWNHIVLVGDTAGRRVYVNGTFRAQGTSTSEGNIFDGLLEIGGSTRFGEDTDGLFSDVAVWNTALTAAQILDLANGAPVITTNKAPVIISLTPEKDDDNVPENTLFRAVFDVPIQPGSGDIRIKNITDDVTTTLDVLDASRVTVSGASITLNPPIAIVSGKMYSIQMDAGVVKTSSNVDFAGIADDETWTFSVDATPPTLVSMVDSVGGGPIYEDRAFFFYDVTFDEPIDGDTVTADDFDTIGTATASIGTVMQLSPAVFEVQVLPTTTGTIQLRIPAGSVIADISGNELDTTSALPDDTTITILSGATPSTGTRYWDGPNAGGIGDGASAGGSGTWNTTTENWDQEFGVNRMAWDNANLDTAVFGGAAGTVTLGEAITAGGIESSVAYTISGANTLTMDVASGTPEINVTANTLSVSSVIEGNKGILKSGGGTLVMTGANDFSGGFTLGAGTVTVSSQSGVLGSGTITFNGGQLRANSNGQSATFSNPLVWNGNYSISRGSTGTATWTFDGNITMNNAITVTHSDNTITTLFNGDISDGGNNRQLILAGNTGFITLAGNNTHGGGTRLNSGTLRINSATALGTGTLAIHGGSIDNVSGSALALADNNTQAWNGNFTFVGSNPLHLGTGAVTINNNRTVTVTASTLTVGGNIGQSGGMRSLTKAGNGTLRLDGENGSYAGANNINGGTLEVVKLANGGVNSSIGASGNAADQLNFNNGGVLRYVGTGDSTDRLFRFNQNAAGAITLDASGTGAIEFTNTGSPTFNGSQTRTLNLIGSNTNLNTLALLLPSAGSTLGVVKDGVGTWVLTGANEYTAGTTINAGTLLVNNTTGSGTGAGAVVVDGGTLGGTGTIDGNVTVEAAGSIAPGVNGVGTLTIGGALDIAAVGTGAGKLIFELDEVTASDKIVVDSLTIGSDLSWDDFTFVDLAGLEEATYTLIASDSVISGELDDTPFSLEGSLGPLFRGTLQISADEKSIELLVVPDSSAPPVILELSPEHNAVGVAPDAVLVATFNRDIELIEDGVITITNLTSGTSTPITLFDGQVSVNDDELRIEVTGGFTLGHTYAVLIDGDSIQDDSSLKFAGIATTDFWRFTIADKPSVAAMGAVAAIGNADLQGQVTDDGGVALTAVRIYFGTSDGGDDPGEWDAPYVFDLGDITVGETFSTNINGLLYGQAYYYRVYAENEHGGTWSATEGPFTTDAPIWTPLVILDEVEFWLDAADADSLDLDVSSVMQWNDKSGNERHVSQSVSGSRPTYASSAVSFNGTSHHLWNDKTFMYQPDGIDIYIVASITAANDRRIIAERSSTATQPIYALAQTHNTTGSRMGGFIRNDANSARVSHAQLNTDAFDNTLKLYHWRDNTTSVAGRINGGAEVTQAYTRDGTLTMDRFAVGALLGSSASSHITGSIREILITSVMTSEEERQTIEGYLAYKWGIDDSLPEGHSFTASSVGVTATLATNITATTAEIQGVLNATQSVFTVTAHWSKMDHQTGAAWLAGYDGSAVVGSFTNEVEIALSAQADGLDPDEEYFFAFRAENAATNLWAENASFETLPEAGEPEVSADGGATGEGVGVATLHGLLTDGGSADAYFVWGTADGGNTDTGLWQNVSAPFVAVQDTGFSLGTSDLLYGVTYNYRVYVSNDVDVAWSDPVETFTTLAPEGLAVETTSATNVTAATADLRGELDAPDSVFTVTAYWSTSNNLDEAAWDADDTKENEVLGAFTNVTSAPLLVSVEELAPQTQYFYTFRAQNVATSLWASTASFETLNLFERTIGLDFENQALGSTNPPPGWVLIASDNSDDAGYVVGEGGYGSGKGGHVTGRTPNWRAGAYIVNSDFLPFDARQPISGSFDFYVEDVGNDSGGNFIFGDIATGRNDQAGESLEFHLRIATFGRRAQILDGAEDNVYSPGTNTERVDPDRWYSTEFTWTPTNGLSGDVYVEWREGSSETVQWMAYEGFTFDNPEVWFGLGSGGRTGAAGDTRFDDVSITGTIIPEDPAVPPEVDLVTNDTADDTIELANPVTYTITFNEALDAETLTADKFSNAAVSPATITVDAVIQRTLAEYDVIITPTTAGDLVLQVSSNVTDLSGNPMDEDFVDATTIVVEDNAPEVTDITSDRDGDTPDIGFPITYTVTFSETMDASTVTTADFVNAAAGGADITVNSVSPETNTNIFTVVVTPSTAGDLTLRVSSGSVKDLSGRATEQNWDDDTTIEVIVSLDPPTVSSFANDTGGNPVLEGHTVVYTITFDNVINAATIGVDAFENASNATITVDSVTPDTNTDEFTVSVTTTSAGGLQLQLLAEAVEGINGVENDVAWTDPMVVTVYPIEPNDGLWNVDSDGNWGDLLNWQDYLIADGTDRTATLGDVITANRVITLDSDRTIGNITAADTSHNYTISGENTLTLDVTSGIPTVSVPTGRALTISSVIDGSDGLAKSGDGTLILSGENAYSGGTDINAGNVHIGADSNLGTVGEGVTFSGSAMLRNTASFTLARPISLTEGAIVDFRNNGGLFTLSGAITGAGGIAFNQDFNPTGNLTLSSTQNTFTGPVQIAVPGYSLKTFILTVNSLGDATGAGNIEFGKSTGSGHTRFIWGSGAVVPLVLNHRRIELVSDTGAVIENAASGSNTITINTDLLVSSSANQTLFLQGANAGDNTFAGAITNGASATISLAKSGAGRWILSGNNTYSGTVTISGGMLEIGGSGTLGNVSPGVGNYAGNISIASTSSGRLVYNSSATQTLGGVISGAGQVFVEHGTLNLDGNNDYTGGTTVNGGTLAVNGSLASAVTISGGTLLVNDSLASSSITFTSGTLGGEGEITGNVTVPAVGNLAPGSDGVGTLNIDGALDISAIADDSGTLFFELGPLAGPNDLIAVSGILTIGASKLRWSDFDFTNLGGMQPGTYTLISTGSEISGTLNTANGNDRGSIGSLDNVRLEIIGHDLVLTVPPQEPEPTVFRFR